MVAEESAYRQGYCIVGRMMAQAMERRRDKPVLAVVAYMQSSLEEAKIHNIEPDWGRIFKESRKIWWENL